MFSWIKAWIKKYDKWCEELGLTPENSAAAWLITVILKDNKQRVGKMTQQISDTFDTHCAMRIFEAFEQGFAPDQSIDGCD